MNAISEGRGWFDRYGESEAPREPTRPLVEAQVAVLKEIAARYSGGAHFSPGDLVRIRPGVNLHHAGYPAVVLETFPPGTWRSPDPDRPGACNWADMRIALLAWSRKDPSPDSLQYIPLIVESWQCEPWKDKAAHE